MASGLDKLEEFLGNFTTLVQAARITDDTTDFRAAQGRRMPGEMLDVLAEKTVSSGQAVLGVIGRLKRNALLSDFPAQNAAVKQRREVLVKEVQDSDAELAALKLDIYEALQDLEALYYSSRVPREPLPGPQGLSEEMKDLQRLVKNVQLTFNK